MKIIDKVKSGVSDFIKGVKVIGNLGHLKGKDRLASMSKVTEALIPSYGKNVIRQQVIKGMEGDIKRALKKGDGSVDKLLNEALACPEYMHLLYRLGMDESNLRAQVVITKNQEKKK